MSDQTNNFSVVIQHEIPHQRGVFFVSNKAITLFQHRNIEKMRLTPIFRLPLEQCSERWAGVA